MRIVSTETRFSTLQTKHYTFGGREWEAGCAILKIPLEFLRNF